MKVDNVSVWISEKIYQKKPPLGLGYNIIFWFFPPTD